MLLSLARLLDFMLASCCLFSLRWQGRQRKWWRILPALLAIALTFYFYRRSSTIHIELDHHIVEDDFIYRRTIMQPPMRKMATHKAGITIHIAMILFFVGQDPYASANAKDSITWAVVYSSAPLHFHILSDSGSVHVVETMMKRAERQANCPFSYTIETVEDVFDSLLEQLQVNVPNLKLDMLREHVVTKMVALLLPWHYPDIQRLVLITSKLKFRSDIVELYQHFEQFDDDQVMGLTLAQDARFGAAFAVHRHLRPESRLGLSPPFGWPGFSTELVLLDLEKMRQSPLVRRYTDLENQFTLIQAYDFNGRNALPDLDEWLTLVAAEKPRLFYTLPCQWNVQQVIDSDAFEYCRSDIKAMTFDS